MSENFVNKASVTCEWSCLYNNIIFRSCRSRLLLGTPFFSIVASALYFGYQCWAFQQNQTGWVSRLLETSVRWMLGECHGILGRKTWPGILQLAWANTVPPMPAHGWGQAGRSMYGISWKVLQGHPVCRQPEKCLAAGIWPSWGSISSLSPPPAVGLGCGGTALEDETQVGNFDLCICRSLAGRSLAGRSGWPVCDRPKLTPISTIPLMVI